MRVTYSTKGTQVECRQGSEFWANVLRPGPKGCRVNGSTVGAACGVDPYRKPCYLFDDMRGIIEGHPFPVRETDAMRHGRACEPFLRAETERVMGYKVLDGNYWVSTEYPDYLGYSPDGLIGLPDRSGQTSDYTWIPLNGICEHKTCFGELYPVDGPIKRAHMAQMMLGMYLTGAPHCDYSYGKLDFENPEWDFAGGLWPFVVKRVHYRERYAAELVERAVLFGKMVDQNARPHDKTPWKDRPRLTMQGIQVDLIYKRGC